MVLENQVAGVAVVVGLIDIKDEVDVRALMRLTTENVT